MMKCGVHEALQRTNDVKILAEELPRSSSWNQTESQNFVGDVSLVKYLCESLYDRYWRSKAWFPMVRAGWTNHISPREVLFSSLSSLDMVVQRESVVRH